MTLKLLKRILAAIDVPDTVQMVSDSGWECCETEMDDIFYNREENKIVFTQGAGSSEWLKRDGWELLYGHQDLWKGSIFMKTKESIISKEDKLLYNTVYSHISNLLDGASGRFPTITATRLNETLYVAVIPGAKSAVPRPKSDSWALIFVEPDARGAFHFEDLEKVVTVDEQNIVSKKRGKAYACRVFTDATLLKLEE